MHFITKIKQIVSSLSVALLLGIIVSIIGANHVYASPIGSVPINTFAAAGCGEGFVPIKDKDGKETGGCKVEASCDSENLDSSNCGIYRILLIAINLLSAMVGVVVVIMVIVGGIQYSSAGADPQKVAAARGKISNALLALVAYLFMFSFLQWVVPGGIF
jgi:hypothetical protein